MPEEGENKLASQPHSPSTQTLRHTTTIERPELNPIKSNTRKTQDHKACSYCYIVAWCDGQTEIPVDVDVQCSRALLRSTQEEERKIQTVLANPNAMRMTTEYWRTHNSATTYHVCVKSHLWATLSATTVTSLGNGGVGGGGVGTTPVISNCD